LKRAIGVVHQRSNWQVSVSTAGGFGGQENRLDGIRFRLIACRDRDITRGGETHERNNHVGAPTRVHGRAIDVGVAGSA
jgi:hypothetical protein